MLIKPKLSLFRFEQRPPLDAGLSLMAPRKRATGRRCERLNLSPAGVQRPGIELTAADAAVEAATQRGLQLIGLLGGLPCRFDSDALPPHPADHVFSAAEAGAYLHYVGHIADRFHGEVQWWESWHHPDRAASWGASPSPAAYAELLRDQQIAIKQANPDALLALGATGGNHLAFLRDVLDHLDGERCFDAIAVHPYRWRNGDNAVRDVRLEDGVTVAAMSWKEELQSIATMVERLGYGEVELWITETDWGGDQPDSIDSHSMVGVGESHRDCLTRSARHVEDTFASLRDDPDLDFVKTGLWFDLDSTRPSIAAAEPPRTEIETPAASVRRHSGLVAAGD